jgi:hypothetical protein
MKSPDALERLGPGWTALFYLGGLLGVVVLIVIGMASLDHRLWPLALVPVAIIYAIPGWVWIVACAAIVGTRLLDWVIVWHASFIARHVEIAVRRAVQEALQDQRQAR